MAEIVASEDFLIGNPERFHDYGRTYIPVRRLVRSIANWRFNAEVTADEKERRTLLLCNRIATRKLERYLKSEEKARQAIAAARIMMGKP